MSARHRAQGVPDLAEQAVTPGHHLIRLDADRGASLAERIVEQIQRLVWQAPFQPARAGRHPLKLLSVPRDPIAGDAAAGAELLDGGIAFGRSRVALADLDFAASGGGSGLADHLHSFAWLRDLDAAATREAGAPIAEALTRRWLGKDGGHPDDAGWRPDLCGRRILAWIAHAPLILSSPDLGYRALVLNTLARGARHLDRTADRMPPGAARVAAWSGVIAAGLMLPGGDARLERGERGLTRALAHGVTGDGGVVGRAPFELLQLIDWLSCLTAVYEERRRAPPAAIGAALARGVPALLGATLGDGRLSSWQGGGPMDAGHVARVIAGSGIRARPQRQSREWGFQRLSGGATVVIADCAPPPATRLGRSGCASTLAFELADGPHRIVVNCGGDRPWSALPGEIADALRTTAAHSTLVLADSNSTAIYRDGSLGKGVTEVALDRQEQQSASRIEASHDGYVRRFGLSHRRKLVLAADGRELVGEDVLLPAAGPREGRTVGFAVRFHLAPGTAAVATAEGMAALLRVEGGPVWQFRCRGGALSIEESIWLDGQGRPVSTAQLVVTGETPPGGMSLSWVLKRAA